MITASLNISLDTNMKKKIVFAAITIVLVIVVINVLNKNKGGSSAGNHPGGRTLSVDMTLGEGGFDASLKAAKELGSQAGAITAYWNELEPDNGNYKPLYYAQASQVFAKEKMSITAGINPIDTMALRLPSDLAGKKFNDPAVIDRYKKAVDFYLSQFKDKKTIMSFVIGNEIDVYLGTNKARWNEYEEFYKAVAPYVKSQLPDAVVGIKYTQLNLVGQAKPYAQSLNQYTDAVMVTYYPLNNDFTVQSPTVVRRDVDAVMKLYPDKKVEFLEFGYPTSALIGSSEDKQAEFVREMFKAWDAYAGRIPIITFFGVSDLTKADLDMYVKYYNLGSQKNFGGYLGTLGLMKADGTHKKAFAVFQEEAKARDW